MSLEAAKQRLQSLMTPKAGAKKGWLKLVVWTALAAVACIIVVTRQLEWYARPRLRQGSGVLRVSLLNDGPLVVTHVVCRGESEGEKLTAPLNPPVAIIDSAGATIDLTKLAWYDIHGSRTDRPSDGRLEILYYVPQQALRN